MKNKETIITHPSQLGSLRRSVLSFIEKTPRGKLILGGDISSHPQKESWERQLNKHYYACGCENAAAGLFIGFILGSAYGAYNYFANDAYLFNCVFNALGLAFVGGVFGKIIGLMGVRKRLDAVISEIQKNWKVRDEIEEAWNCG